MCEPVFTQHDNGREGHTVGNVKGHPEQMNGACGERDRLPPLPGAAPIAGERVLDVVSAGIEDLLELDPVDDLLTCVGVGRGRSGDR